MAEKYKWRCKAALKTAPAAQKLESKTRMRVSAEKILLWEAEERRKVLDALVEVLSCICPLNMILLMGAWCMSMDSDNQEKLTILPEQHPSSVLAAQLQDLCWIPLTPLEQIRTPCPSHKRVSLVK
ncbi:hypothetical protein HHK36_025379 [Tetracentron sinense]|uniref:Uncharacterized protein n=1 Tax=Tetracentron sinense TaxID=13715 RepID=A0A835D6B9_TETSI|nr:hypothetical protein HHK36_025379 [Tetracentron sinense]